MRKELLKGLSEEQIKKVEACKSPEEIMELAKAEGVQLNDEQLEAVSGGGCADDLNPLVEQVEDLVMPGQSGLTCPQCGSGDLERSRMQTGKTVVEEFCKCQSCGYSWYNRWQKRRGNVLQIK